MNEQNNNSRGVFYGVIGVATLIVAIIGATFAYFTATASNNNVIKGNMATITFDLKVAKVTEADDDQGGMIPMSNSMAHPATTSSKGICLDNNGNAVCQIYKITVTNTGSASLFLDGYVTLTGGSGVPTDWPTGNLAITEDVTEINKWVNVAEGTETTMRWAQAFCTTYTADDTETQGAEPTKKVGDVKTCTTVGKTTTGATGASGGANSVTGIDEAWGELGTTTAATAGVTDKSEITKKVAIAHDVSNIKTSNVTSTGYITGNDYDIISTNYVRISDHEAGASYDRNTDISSALVFNQFLNAATTVDDSDEQDFYIVVWLSETGTNQTVNSGETNVPTKTDSADGSVGFFSGNVTFNSAQGSEVTATFSGYAAVSSQSQAAS